jgi:outer membrane protein assembly factor BamB
VIRTTLPTALLISRLPKKSQLAEQLRRADAPKRLDLDAFEAEVSRAGSLSAAEAKAVALPRQILTAQPLDTERGRALRDSVGGPERRAPSPVRSQKWSVHGVGLSGDPCLSHDGKTIYQLNQLSELTAFARSDGAQLWSLPLGGGWSFFKPQLSPDGKRLLITTSVTSGRDIQQVSMVDLQSREVKWKHDVSGWPVKAPATFSAEGNALISSHGDKRVGEYHAETGAPLFEVEIPTLRNDAFEDVPVLSTADGSTRIFTHQQYRETPALQEQYALGPSGEVRWMRQSDRDVGIVHGFSPDQKSVLIAGDSRITCRSVDTGDDEWTINAKFGGAYHPPVFSPEGSKIAVAGSDGLFVFDAESRQQLFAMTKTWQNWMHRHPLAFTPDASAVVALHDDGSLQHFTIDDDAQRALSTPAKRVEGWTADGQWGFVVAGGKLESIHLVPEDK